MKKVRELSLGFPDAENFKRRENRQLFSQSFLRTPELDKLSDPGVCFLIGEKGTGKTAYAAYYWLNPHRNNRAEVRDIRETEYRKFVALRAERHLDLSDFVQIWKVILYLLIAEQIVDHDGSLVARFIKLRAIKSAIDTFYDNAFAPEIIHAMEFAVKADVAAKMVAQGVGDVGATLSQSATDKRSFFQVHLLQIQKAFEDALRSLRLDHGEILFIDGIDVRPSSIPYDQYLDCIKGLANAVWQVNNDFFANIKDSPGRLRVVVLMRPDIFDSLDLQNSNSKISSNSVVLDWRTNHDAYRSSNLFKVVDLLLSAQQAAAMEEGQALDYYLPSPPQHPFRDLLRLSFQRPRDLIKMLELLQVLTIQERDPESTQFPKGLADSAEFKSRYSTYLLGEIKDALLFYFSRNEFDLFLKFFDFLKGHQHFDYRTFLTAYHALSNHADQIRAQLPVFMSSAARFLQFLYDHNVICYFETTERREKFVRWCFRERNYGNMSPKVKAEVEYEVHPGLTRALNLGAHLADAGRPAAAPQPARGEKRHAGRAKSRRQPRS